jgi:hypothetical protein
LQAFVAASAVAGAGRMKAFVKRQAPPGVPAPMIGMMKSATSESTTLVRAAPITTATARASTFLLDEERLEITPHGTSGV